MARNMGDNGEAFRAVITHTTTKTDGTVTSRTYYEGPYATVGAAKSRITWAKRNRRNGYRNAWDLSETVITAHVEKAVTNWEPVP